MVNRQNTNVIILIVLHWVTNLPSRRLPSSLITSQLIRALFQPGHGYSRFHCLFVQIQDLVRLIVLKIHLGRPLKLLLPFMVLEQTMISYVRGNPASLVGYSSVPTGFLRLTARQKRRLATFLGIIGER